MLSRSTSSCLYCGSQTKENSLYCCASCEILGLGTLPEESLSLQNPFAYLDDPKFRESYVSNTNEYTFFVQGMHCSACVHLLEKLPEFIGDVTSARTNFATSTLKITLNEKGSLAQVANTIQRLGYEPSLISKQDLLEDHYQKDNRKALMRIAVAGFSAGNIMLFVIPVYAGLTGIGAVIFNWLSFLLFLPVLFFSAVPFYKGAWNALRHKTVNVDLPIAIAMLTGFLLSTVNLIRNDGAIYFDSTASFLFLILSARYLLKKTQQNYLSPHTFKSLFGSAKYLKIHGALEEVVPFEAVKEGDVLKLEQDQVIPGDCELLSASASVDMSLFNGESLPRVYSKGMGLFAGTKVMTPDVLVKIKKDFSGSKVGDLCKQLHENSYHKNAFVGLTDKLAQILIITVFSLAVVFFAAYVWVDASEAFNRALALIVLACPCALAFGSPLAYGLALKKARGLGIFLKDSAVLDRMLNIKNVFFDKTGTLTQGTLTLSQVQPAVLPAEIQKAILSLEAHSYHPVAFAIRKAWPCAEALPPASEVKEYLGKGIRGLIDGDVYEIYHLAESIHEAELAVEIKRNGSHLARLYFTDQLRPEAKFCVKELAVMGLKVHLASGDRKVRVAEVAAHCGISPENTFAEVFPEDKKLLVENHRPSCMIGDGANDALALKTADVGIAVQGSIDLSLKSADVYFSKGGLSPLLDLFSIAKKARRTLVMNLAISLIYNSIGATLALLGFIDPMVAAILMPASSAVLVLSTWWGLK